MPKFKAGQAINWDGYTFEVLSYNDLSKTYTVKAHKSRDTYEVPEEAVISAP